MLQRIVPRLLDDAATRQAMADEVLQDRIVHWPVLNIVHTVIQPLFSLLRNAVSRTGAPVEDIEAMVDGLMKLSGESVASMVQSAFAQLRHSQPAVAPLYGNNKLWEDLPADHAAGGLRRVLAEAATRQAPPPCAGSLSMPHSRSPLCAGY